MSPARATMDEATRRLIEEIHAAPAQCVLAVTGGGASVIGALLSVPGGSRTLLEAFVPYDEAALVEFLGHAPHGFCSAQTGLELAERAFARAGWLAAGRDVIGIGVTAGLVSDRPKKGDHRFHAAFHSGNRQVRVALTLTKGARNRLEEEHLVQTALLNLLAEAFGVGTRLPLPLLKEERLECETIELGDPLAQLLAGKLDRLCVTTDGRMGLDTPTPAVLLPGSFNPVHTAHWHLAQVAGQHLQQPAAFEISVFNVDKPPLTRAEVMRRLAPFTWRAEVWLTRAPTFPEKAALFPNATFAVGSDTAERIIQPRYYDNSSDKMNAALDSFARQGCRFLVAGRTDDAGVFRTLDDIAVPEQLRHLFAGIPQSEFHINLSSTELRQRAAKE